MRYLILQLLLLAPFLNAQNPYPQDYFRDPLNIPIVLSGTFGELRSNHFHSGLDIKTQQRQGLDVVAVADGYVSRIKISHFGYGKALYITHPNGYTSVYAHLQKFNDSIEAYVKAAQYKAEQFEIELFPSAGELEVSKGERVAYSGNTGGSAAPHLHFEIRDNNERPLNPMLFGIDSKDTRRPSLLAAYAYPLDDTAHVNGEQERVKLRLIPQDGGDFLAETITAHGRIGIGVVAYDRQDFASNRNGVNNIQTLFNGQRKLELDFTRFSFAETIHINGLIDYEYFVKKRSRIQKLFKEPRNPLSVYRNTDEDGAIEVLDSTASVFKVRVSDFEGNETWLTVPIKGQRSDTLVPKQQARYENYIYANQPNILEQDNVRVDFQPRTFYNDFFIDFDVTNDTLHLHDNSIAALKYFKITFDVSHYNELDKQRIYIARTGRNNRLYHVGTQRNGDEISARSRILGKYTLAIDDKNPKIRPSNFQDGKWLSRYRYLKLKINDPETGIKSYRATVNGKWILTEYDYKTKTLTQKCLPIWV